MQPACDTSSDLLGQSASYLPPGLLHTNFNLLTNPQAHSDQCLVSCNNNLELVGRSGLGKLTGPRYDQVEKQSSTVRPLQPV